MRTDDPKSGVSRRFVLKSAAAGSALIAAPFVWRSPARAAGSVIVRTVGGAYEDAVTKAVFEPFTRETGIEVVKAPMGFARLMAMLETGRFELDVLDTGEAGLIAFRDKDALEKIDYSSWTFTNPDDLAPDMRRDDMTGFCYFSTVMAYNTNAFPAGKAPSSWTEFWDAAKFPGERSLADIKAGYPDLEVALLAAGVSKDALYPIDLDRAFRSLEAIRPSIRTFWESAAIVMQMLSNNEVAASTVWSGRAQDYIDQGHPLAIQWNGASLQRELWAIPKGAANAENAQKFVDFASRPDVQANLTKGIPYGPANTKAFDHIDAATLDRLPNNPEHLAQAFYHDGEWWARNRQEVDARWAAWLLQ